MTANSPKPGRKAANVSEGAAGAEKSRIDDEAVSKAVTVESGAAGTTSVLPGPPIPPERQAEVRDTKGSSRNDNETKKPKDHQSRR